MLESVDYVVQSIRALVTSSKPPITIKSIVKDYQEVEGSPLPLKALGYSSVEQLLQDSGEFDFYRSGNEMCISAKYNKNSAHIVDMVKKQKASKTKRLTPLRNISTSHRYNYQRQQHFDSKPQFLNRNNSTYNYSRSNSLQTKSVNDRLPISMSKQMPSVFLAKKTDVSVQPCTKTSNLSLDTEKTQSDLRDYLNKKKMNIDFEHQQKDIADLRDHLKKKGETQQKSVQQPKSRPILGEKAPKSSDNSILKTLSRNEDNSKINSCMQQNQIGKQPVLQLQDSNQLSNKQELRSNLDSTKHVSNKMTINNTQYHPSANVSQASTITNNIVQQYMSTSKPELTENIKYPKLKIKPNVVRSEKDQFNFSWHSNPMVALENYCNFRRYLAPKYSVLKFNRLYLCSVEVNQKTYTSHEHQFEQQAQMQCAQKAIESIQELEARCQLPICTDSDYQLIDKLYRELQTRSNGMILKNIPDWFENTYQQSLPEHWISLVKKSSQFLEEETTTGMTILYANMNVSKDDEAITIQMDGILLPWKDRTWQLHVTYCASPVEIWARLIDYNDQFVNLIADIDLYMSSKKKRAMPIKCGQCYLYKLEDWCRVRVEQMNKEEETALCFFFDCGYTFWLKMEKLFECEPRFLQLPVQCIPFSLFGLEDLEGYEKAKSKLDILVGRSLVGEILTKENEFYAMDSKSRAAIAVVLFDTSTAEDLNLNDELMKSICECAEVPVLDKKVTNVQITHISDEGDVYVQVINNEFRYMQKLVQKLIEIKLNNDVHTVSASDLKHSTMFLVGDKTDDMDIRTWHRCTLADKSNVQQIEKPDDMIEIFYVDVGKRSCTKLSNLIRLESLSFALSKFPHQAIRTRLDNIPPINITIVGRLRALLPNNSQALVKQNISGTVPTVTIYKRLENNTTLCPINDIIRIEHEIESCIHADDDSEEQTQFDQSHSQSSLGTPVDARREPFSSFVDMTRGLTIKAVPNLTQHQGSLPKLKNYDLEMAVGSYIEVRVSLSANPSNFTVQSYRDYPRLRELMRDLQEYCEKNDEFIPTDLVQIGEAYAAKNSDGFYQRVIVVNTYMGEMIHVCFCDFGDIAILRSDQLKILPNKFRRLPKMAIPAKLYGIKAPHGDWTLDQCLRFRALTVGKKFSALIKDINADKTLILQLIDVSTDDDIYIHKLLTDEGIAIEDI